MDKKNIIGILVKNKNITPSEESAKAKEDNLKNDNIIEAIKESLNELENARVFFEAVSDPKLVDYAIYMEAAAQSRYTYLIHQAKEKGITVDVGSLLIEVNAV